MAPDEKDDTIGADIIGWRDLNADSVVYFWQEVTSMSTDQLKAIFIEKIMYEQNEETLQGILSLLGHDDSAPIILSPQQRASIAEGMSDYKAGNLVAIKELNRQENEWL